jgi:hypothetical protein
MAFARILTKAEQCSLGAGSGIAGCPKHLIDKLLTSLPNLRVIQFTNGRLFDSLDFSQWTFSKHIVNINVC